MKQIHDHNSKINNNIEKSIFLHVNTVGVLKPTVESICISLKWVGKVVHSLTPFAEKKDGLNDVAHLGTL